MFSTHHSQPPFSSTKLLSGYPCAHRQHAHKGHCRFIHGYSRSFKFKFAAHSLDDETNFVIDFGAMGFLKQFLKKNFDHTCLINEDDPEMALFTRMHQTSIIKLVVLPNVGMESTAKWVAEHVQDWLHYSTKGRVWCYEVECKENEKNSGIWHGSRTNPQNPYVRIDMTTISKQFPRTFEKLKSALSNDEYVTYVGMIKDEFRFLSYSNQSDAVDAKDYRKPYRLYKPVEIGEGYLLETYTPQHIGVKY